MARQLCAYREAIVETARCHRWENVVRYDRCFWLAAAGKPGMAWDKIDVALLVREVTTPATIAGRGPSGPGNRGDQSAHGQGPREKGDSRGPAIGITDRMEAAHLGNCADLCMCVQDVEESILCHSVVAIMSAKGWRWKQEAAGEG